MNITREQAAALGRRASQPVKAEGELIAVFCAGNLVNTKNARLHYMAESRYKRGWRDRVANALLESAWAEFLYGYPTTLNIIPKRVHFSANVHSLMDGDGLQVACAPIRDALIDCSVIHGDADKHGHAFIYDQQIDRKNRGVTIRVSLLTDGV